MERLARCAEVTGLVGVVTNGAGVVTTGAGVNTTGASVVTTGAGVDGVVWRSADVRDPLLSARFEGIDVVVHLAMTYDPAQDPTQRRLVNVRGTSQVLEAARAAGVRRVVLVTSSDVYGSHPDGPVPLPDDAELRAEPDDGLVGDLVEVERLAQHSARAGLPVTVLRPAPVVGGPLGRAYDGALPRQLASTRLLALRGVEPLWQLCHIEDLLGALELAGTGAITGIVPVASQGWLVQAEVEQLTGKRRLELPAAVALSTAERLRRLGVTANSRPELDRLVAPIVVDTVALRQAGWTPRWTNESAVRAYLATSPASDSRSGAYTAAGATVALVGTAALVRRARRRRRSL